MNLEEFKQAALPACKRYDVKRLDVFGSLARGAISPSSDIDLLVEFHDPGREPARRFFGFLHYLEDLLDCSIDLLTATSLRNPYFRARIEREKVPVYEG